MLGGTQKLSIKDESGKKSTIEAGEVRFTVEEIFKGSNAEELTIQIDSHKGTRGSKAGKTPNEDAPMHSPSRKLPINDNVKNLKLTLSKAGRVGGGCP